MGNQQSLEFPAFYRVDHTKQDVSEALGNAIGTPRSPLRDIAPRASPPALCANWFGHRA